jgi:hypothetical protein
VAGCRIKALAIPSVKGETPFSAASVILMARDPTDQTTPDQRSTQEGQISDQIDSPDRRYVLPKDLPKAVKHLNDQELERLLDATVEEAKRRGRLPPLIDAEPAPSAPTETPSPKRQDDFATLSLTRGQISAVRAALTAGIKPSLIARQFGISQSDVRKVLSLGKSK